MNLDFRCSYKSKNNGEKLLPRSLLMKLFEATTWFCWTRKEAILTPPIAVVNGCIAYILVACDLYSSCRINKPQLSIGEWLRNHEETTLVFFRSWSRYFSSMYFHVFFDKLSNKLPWIFLFVWHFPDEIAFSSILRNDWLKRAPFCPSLKKKKSRLQLPILNGRVHRPYMESMVQWLQHNG